MNCVRVGGRFFFFFFVLVSGRFRFLGFVYVFIPDFCFLFSFFFLICTKDGSVFF